MIASGRPGDIHGRGRTNRQTKLAKRHSPNVVVGVQKHRSSCYEKQRGSYLVMHYYFNRLWHLDTSFWLLSPVVVVFSCSYVIQFDVMPYKVTTWKVYSLVLAKID